MDVNTTRTDMMVLLKENGVEYQHLNQCCCDEILTLSLLFGNKGEKAVNNALEDHDFAIYFAPSNKLVKAISFNSKDKDSKSNVAAELASYIKDRFKNLGASRSQIAFNETIEDPIFLFQVKVYGDIKNEYLSKVEWGNHMEELINIESREAISQEQADVILNYQWRTKSAWMTREEAEKIADNKPYAYGKKGVDWRVHCISAKGVLADYLSKYDTNNSLK